MPKTRTPMLLIIHNNDLHSQTIMNVWQEKNYDFANINLNCLSQYQFASSQDGTSQNLFFMKNHLGLLLDLNHIQGLYCPQIILPKDTYQHHTFKDKVYLYQAWLAFFYWLAKTIPRQLNILNHLTGSLSACHLLTLKKHCKQVGLGFPKIALWPNLSKEQQNQPWIGRTTFNHHYDFRPQKNKSAPIVMAPPPKKCEMIWLHCIGELTFASHAKKTPYFIPESIRNQCLQIMSNMRFTCGQFLLCQTKNSWICYDFNQNPNWDLCHLSAPSIAKIITDYLLMVNDDHNEHTENLSSKKTELTPFKTLCEWKITKQPETSPAIFINKNLRPTLFGSQYTPESQQ